MKSQVCVHTRLISKRTISIIGRNDNLFSNDNQICHFTDFSPVIINPLAFNIKIMLNVDYRIWKNRTLESYYTYNKTRLFRLWVLSYGQFFLLQNIIKPPKIRFRTFSCRKCRVYSTVSGYLFTYLKNVKGCISQCYIINVLSMLCNITYCCYSYVTYFITIFHNY